MNVKSSSTQIQKRIQQNTRNGIHLTNFRHLQMRYLYQKWLFRLSTLKEKHRYSWGTTGRHLKLKINSTSKIY